MSQFIDLDRRFHDLTEKEVGDPELLASLNTFSFGSRDGWPELAETRRLLILAEAGSGKTREMQEQVRRTTAAGQFAFYVALESLGKEGLREVLAVEEARFNAWLSTPGAPGWFFLDAVDELKLTDGKLDTALRRFASAVGAQLDRARVVISCRPSDWRPVTDAAVVKERLQPPPVAAKPEDAPDAEERFLGPLRQERVKDEQSAGQNAPAALLDLRTVLLLPLGDTQIRIFAERSGLADPTAFLAAIARHDAWTFARRPLDLIELIAAWRQDGRFGTRLEQHEANITNKLRDDPDRPDNGVLGDAKARDGAERLALALMLTRTRTMRSPDQPLGDGRADAVLDPAAILADWTPAERQALLRRALYDPATYGRVRFHHRSVQEYLAARRLQHLRAEGMSRKSLRRLLFAELYGERVVIPSIRPIAAWLALWEEDVRRELTAREPEALLAYGDPESLDVSTRAALLRAYASAYGEGGWRGVNVPVDQVRRLAHAELAPIVRELWGEGPANDEVRELLIETIWQGRIAACADLVENAAYDPGCPAHHRVRAIRALIDCQATSSVVAIAKSILKQPSVWAPRIVHSVADDLFPEFLSVDDLMTLIERTPEGRSVTDGFAWILPHIVARMQSSSVDADSLRDRLASLIWSDRKVRKRHEPLSSGFGYLAPALATLCERQLGETPAAASANLMRACVIASRFEDSHGVRDEAGKALRSRIRGSAHRAAAFWEELAVMDELLLTTDARDRLFETEFGGLIGQVEQSERPWLETAVADRTQPRRRPVALLALLRLWHLRGRLTDEAAALRGLVSDDATLESELDRAIAPPTIDPDHERWERDRRRRQLVYEGRERQGLQKSLAWRMGLISDPVAAFAPDRRNGTVAGLYNWLRAERRTHDRAHVWDERAIAEAFSPEVAALSAQAVRQLWRETEPPLWSARAPDARNTYYDSWFHGLCGVASEASTAGWAGRLTVDEARRAAIYATLELNGFAGFIGELAAAHPTEVEAVLGDELAVQITLGADENYLPMLQDVSYSEPPLKRLLAPRLLAALETWPTVTPGDHAKNWSHHLEQALRALDACDAQDDRRRIAAICSDRFTRDPAGPLALEWLRGLLRFDPVSGAELWTAALAHDIAVRARAIEMFSALFGHRGGVAIKVEDPTLRAKTLAQLVRAAYAQVRVADDRRHEGSYSPDTRDDAERARNSLLGALLETPGRRAYDEVLALAAETDFGHFPDRLKILARNKAATDAEFDAFTTSDLLTLDKYCEAPPRSRDGLFQLMIDRLDDLAHDVAHHDFTDRRTLRTISEETEMQRTLALRLEGKASGAYRIVREDEVADSKRTDIRFVAVRGGQKAVAEVKIADNDWSVADLERALENQLVGQYLRHESCKAGCLLLTYAGKKKWWADPETGAQMTFGELCLHLQTKAAALEGATGGVRLAVVGIDLTDPVLAPAHRSATAKATARVV